MSNCITVEAWMDPSDEERRHVASCAECQALTQEVEAVRELARLLPPSGWAGEPGPDVDVEAALASVLSGGRQAPRRRRAPRVLQFASSLAAAAVLFLTVAPSLVRWRIDSQPTAQAPQQLSGAATANTIFWTTAGGR
jgi:hypothetical protein